VRFGDIERAIQSAVLVREGVLAVGVGLDVGVQRDRAILVAELEGGLGRGVEPRGHVVDVAHRRREGDHARVTEATHPGDGHFQHRSTPVRIEQVHLVDDTAVDVGDEAVAPGIVFAGRGVGLLRRHHEDVGPFGASGLRSRSPVTT